MTVTENKSTLRDAWNGLQQTKPGLRIREAAKELGVSEAELLATRVGEGVTRLQGPWEKLLTSFKTLGRVMSLTRNDACVLEHKGSFQDIDIMGEGARAMATVIGPIESRVFFSGWHLAFAVTEQKPDRVLKSIQVFDKAGEAVTKIYLQEKSNEEAYVAIVNDFRAHDQQASLELSAYPKEEFSTTVDTETFLKDWTELKDTHEFFGMIRKHKVHRYHALELAAGKFTYTVDPAKATQQVLDSAAERKLPIMIFAGNRGNLQIHQGKVRTIRVLNQGHGGAQTWLNVLDPDFNMHLRIDLVKSAWVVKKPTTDGHVTSIELFDEDKNMVAQFFGLRKPGIPEKLEWRALVDTLAPLA